MAEASQPTRETRAARRRGGMIALARLRIRRSGGGRLARVAGIPLLIGFAAAILVLRVSDGPDAPLAGLVSLSARWITWLVGVPLAFAIAGDRRALDRRDGVDALAFARGFSSQSLEYARLLGAMIETSMAIGRSIVLLALLTAALAGSIPQAIARLMLATSAAGYGVVAGVTLGGVAAICGRVGRSRGRWLFFAVAVGPWILADLAGYGAFSIPGALAAALDFALGGAGS